MYAFSALESEAARAATSKSYTAYVPDWATKWSVVRQSNNEVVLSTDVAAINANPTVRFARSTVSNIFSGSQTQRLTNALTSRGIRLLAQFNDFVRLEDTEQTPNQIWLPVTAHTVITVPAITFDTTNTAGRIANEALSSTLGAFMETAEGSTITRLNQMLRGGLVPSIIR